MSLLKWVFASSSVVHRNYSLCFVLEERPLFNFLFFFFKSPPSSTLGLYNIIMDIDSNISYTYLIAHIFFCFFKESFC